MATSETPKNSAGGQAEHQSFGAMLDAAVGRGRQERGADREDRALDGDQRRQRRAARSGCADAQRPREDRDQPPDRTPFWSETERPHYEAGAGPGSVRRARLPGT
jgi:hypothetical protein